MKHYQKVLWSALIGCSLAACGQKATEADPQNSDPVVDGGGCSNGKAGPNCDIDITCKNGVVNNSTGHCIDKTCLEDWVGTDCDIAITCKHGVVDEATGHCTADSCSDTWVGADCNDCDSDWIGTDCDIAKACKNGVLDNLTGHCINDTCLDDWLGTDCDIAKACKNGVLNNSDGHCVANTCLGGWVGIDCNIENLCQNGSVDVTTGHCEDGCSDGWVGVDCNVERFCQKGVVDVTTGHCVVDGCSDGWSGLDCNKGTYKDRDDHTYNTVIINGLEWYAENSVYNDTNVDCMKNPEHEDYGCYYMGDKSYSVCNSEDGWRLPKQNYKGIGEVKDLWDFAGVDNVKDAIGVFGKEGAWSNYSGEVNDTYGFSALPSGYYFGQLSRFQNEGYTTSFWCDGRNGDEYQVTFGLDSTGQLLKFGSSGVTNRNPVRCVRELK